MTDIIKKIQNLQYIYDDNDPVKRKELINHLTRDKKKPIQTRTAPFKKKSNTGVPLNIDIKPLPSFSGLTSAALFFDTKPTVQDRQDKLAKVGGGLVKILEAEDVKSS